MIPCKCLNVSLLLTLMPHEYGKFILVWFDLGGRQELIPVQFLSDAYINPHNNWNKNNEVREINQNKKIPYINESLSSFSISSKQLCHVHKIWILSSISQLFSCCCDWSSWRRIIDREEVRIDEKQNQSEIEQLCQVPSILWSTIL